MQTKESKANNGEMSLADHFHEFRARLAFSALFLVLSFCTSYYFAAEIFQFLLKPLSEAASSQISSFPRRIIFTSPSEAFFSYLKLSFYCSIFISLPVLLVQIYLFLAPGLYKHEKKVVFSLFFMANFLFSLGAIFSFYLVLPPALKFFLGFEIFNQNSDFLLPIAMETRISDYLSFVWTLCFGFGIAFILPIFLLAAIKAEFISADLLRRKRRYVVIVVFVIAAILTPPDVISQTCLALALLLLFELVILFGRSK